eukprot:gene3828-6338_t
MQWNTSDGRSNLSLLHLLAHQSVLWYVLRQDTFGKPGAQRATRLEVYSGKTLINAYDLTDARIIPLVKPLHSFEVTLRNGIKVILQPESETSEACAEWVAALQTSVTTPVTFKDVRETEQLARESQVRQQYAAQSASSSVLESSHEEGTNSRKFSEYGDRPMDTESKMSATFSSSLSNAATNASIDVGDGWCEQLDFTQRPHQTVTPAGCVLYSKCLQQRLNDLAASFTVKIQGRIAQKRREISTNTDFLLSLARGKFDPALHPFYSNHWQVFLSSTFRDTQAERNAIFKHVLPVVKTWAHPFGITFSITDMRWGASSELSSEDAIEACLREVKECMKTTRPAISFISFMTQRSGYRLIPSSLTVENFNAYLEKCRDENAKTFRETYRLDENAVPPEYHLVCMPSDNDMLFQLFKENNVSIPTATELEVLTALQENNVSPRNFLWLERTICGEALKQEDIDIYFDRKAMEDPQETVQQIETKQSQALATQVKFLQIVQALQSSGIPCRSYKVQWVEEGLQYDSAFIDYITEYCVDLTRALLNSLGESFENDLHVTLPEWCKEAVEHIQFALFKAQHTIARDEAMDVIHAHLNSDSCSPVIVTGGSGTGKTTFLAQLVDILRRSDDVIVAARFAGATCKSTSLTHTLRLLTQQLLFLVHPNTDIETIPSDFRALIAALPQHIANLNALNRKVVLVIDSLDEYVDDENRLDERVGLSAWLPVSLPPNVKLIVSARSHDVAIQQLSDLFDNPNLITLGALDPSEAMLVVSTALKLNKREMTRDQCDLVQKSFEAANPLPLSAALVAEMACSWQSNITPPAIETSMLPLIDSRLKSAEDSLGSIFVSRALGFDEHTVDTVIQFLCLCHISRFDTLPSPDSDVMTALTDHHVPPDGAVPQHLIFMLRSQLALQLSIGADERISWVHRLYKQASELRYLSDPGTKASLQVSAGKVLLKQLHQLVADKDSPGKSGSSPDIQHLVDIVPWLFLQAQNESLLREALLIPQVFMCLGDNLYKDLSYDLSSYWQFLGDGPDEIVHGFSDLLDPSTMTESTAQFLHWGLATYLYSTRHFQHALEVLDPCNVWRRKQLGEHEDTALTINFQGMCALEMGNRALALELFEEALAMRLKLNKTANLSKAIAASYNNIAIIHKREGRFEQALETYNCALELQKKINPNEDNVSIMQIMNNVASVHSVIGDYPKAYDLYKLVAERRRKYFGPSIPLSVALFNLGLVAFRQGRYGLAQEHIQDCLDIRLELLGPTHQSTASAMSLTAHILLRTNQPEQGKDIFLRVLHIREESSNKGNLSMTYADVARACTCLGEYDEASSYLEKSKSLCNDDPLDPRNADYTEAAADLAYATGDSEKACILYAECIDLYRHTYDTDHPQMQRIHAKMKNAVSHSEKSEDPVTCADDDSTTLGCLTLDSDLATNAEA